MNTPNEVFSAEEQDILSPYVTNTNRSVFVLTNLPEVIKGALFSRYSRSTLGLRTLLLKEFIQKKESKFEQIQGGGNNKNLQKTLNWQLKPHKIFMTGFLMVMVMILSASLGVHTWLWKTSLFWPQKKWKMQG